jgi:hypothetical protein
MVALYNRQIADDTPKHTYYHYTTAVGIQLLTGTNFDVSLTVHLSITQSMYQLDAPIPLLFI